MRTAKLCVSSGKTKVYGAGSGYTEMEGVKKRKKRRKGRKDKKEEGGGRRRRINFY